MGFIWSYLHLLKEGLANLHNMFDFDNILSDIIWISGVLGVGVRGGEGLQTSGLSLISNSC